jgi:hypothetical protein
MIDVILIKTLEENFKIGEIDYGSSKELDI